MGPQRGELGGRWTLRHREKPPGRGPGQKGQVAWFTLESLTNHLGRATVDNSVAKAVAKITRSTSSPNETARVAIEAGRRAQGRRVILARGWAELAPIDDADDCFVVGEVNQQALFPRVAAVVHHGGAGTTTTASRSGTSQVVVPQIGDQPSWAARVAELGIGVAHQGPRHRPSTP